MEPRHPAAVRITHWINATTVVALAVSGVAILLAHPRLYWGETGAVGGPSILDLPLPFILTGQSGWGRYLHFLSAWVFVANGVAYALTGMLAGHFRVSLFAYPAWQRRTYAVVVFVLAPLLIWTGLAMSPAITSVFPILVTAFGGQQSARTLHFVAAVALLLFALGHVVMVASSGFLRQLLAMTTGRAMPSGEPT